MAWSDLMVLEGCSHLCLRVWLLWTRSGLCRHLWSMVELWTKIEVCRHLDLGWRVGSWWPISMLGILSLCEGLRDWCSLLMGTDESGFLTAE